ncbi:MCE family protein [Haloechinothrix halophila]|uniref:MCE family protein n=1 Tax=Haloechinothrix halophila TaxID=1069073 RepID=UPI000558F029
MGLRTTLGPTLPSLLKLIAFTVVTVVLTGVLAATIANTSFDDKAGYAARFTDVSGLRNGDDVRISGVKVGQVRTIEIGDDAVATVHFDVGQSYRLPSTTTARVKYRNVIGQRYLALGTHVASDEPLRKGDVIGVDRTTPALNLTVLFNGFKPLFTALDPKQINQLSYEIIQVFQGEGGTISSLLRHTASLTTTIADRDKVIGEVVGNLNDVLGTINNRDEQAKELIDALQQLISGLAEKRKPIGEATEALGALTGSVSGLVSDARPPLRKNVRELNDLAGTLSKDAPVLDEILHRLPRNVKKYTRVLSYGSWYNYYLCDISGTVGIGSLNVTIPVVPLPATDRPERCGP